jgi:hypothetical protein
MTEWSPSPKGEAKLPACLATITLPWCGSTDLGGTFTSEGIHVRFSPLLRAEQKPIPPATAAVLRAVTATVLSAAQGATQRAHEALILRLFSASNLGPEAPRVRDVMASLPRALFAPEKFASSASLDSPLDLGPDLNTKLSAV